VAIQTRTSDQILSAALTRILDETDITVQSPGSVIRTLFEIFAEEMAFDYRVFENNATQLYLSTSTGDSLDKLAELFGISRTITGGSLSSNLGIVYFYLNSSADHVPGTSDMMAAGNIVIPAGALLSTAVIETMRDPVTWRTTAAVTILEDSYMSYASVEPVTYNQYTIGEATLVYHDLDTTTYPYVYVYNRADLEAKPSYESDTNLRYRISQAIQGIAGGNETALRLAVLAVDGVRDCVVTPKLHGIGTVDVTVVLEDPGNTDASTIFSNASTAVNEIAAAGDMVFINRPVERRVDISGTIKYTTTAYSSSSVAAAVEASITRYLNSLSIGDPIIWSRLISDVITTSPQIRDFDIIDGEFMVDNESMAKGNVTAKAAEQFYPGSITVS
jgi:uncharacterized phage protein gp47/JayE